MTLSWRVQTVDAWDLARNLKDFRGQPLVEPEWPSNRVEREHRHTPGWMRADTWE